MGANGWSLVFIACISLTSSQKCSSSPTKKYFCNQPATETCCTPCCCTEYTPVVPCQQVLTSPVYTTIVDNSVSNALANAIQLLIVSNLVESTMACKGCRNNVEEASGCDNEVTEVVYDVPCGAIPDCTPEAELANTSDLTSLSPCLAEALFPSSIPAQLVCNFGYNQQTKPCVSFNVEPLPGMDSCQCGGCI